VRGRHAGRVASRPREADRQTCSHWITNTDKRYRYGGRGLGDSYRRRRAPNNQDARPGLDKTVYDAGDEVEVTFQVVVVERDALALDVSQLAEAIVEGCDNPGRCGSREWIDHSDSWSLFRLLRPSGERRGEATGQ